MREMPQRGRRCLSTWLKRPREQVVETGLHLVRQVAAIVDNRVKQLPWQMKASFECSRLHACVPIACMRADCVRADVKLQRTREACVAVT